MEDYTFDDDGNMMMSEKVRREIEVNLYGKYLSRMEIKDTTKVQMLMDKIGSYDFNIPLCFIHDQDICNTIVMVSLVHIYQTSNRILTDKVVNASELLLEYFGDAIDVTSEELLFNDVLFVRMGYGEFPNKMYGNLLTQLAYDRYHAGKKTIFILKGSITDITDSAMWKTDKGEPLSNVAKVIDLRRIR